MADVITCPSGLSGRIRGMKVREERVLADRKLAKSGGQIDELLGSCWEETLGPGPYKFGEGEKLDWGNVLQGDRFGYRLRLSRPRCRGEVGRALFFRLRRRRASSRAVAVGAPLPSNCMTSTSPSPSGAGACPMKSATCSPSPSTGCSMTSVDGALGMNVPNVVPASANDILVARRAAAMREVAMRELRANEPGQARASGECQNEHLRGGKLAAHRFLPVRSRRRSAIMLQPQGAFDPPGGAWEVEYRGVCKRVVLAERLRSHDALQLRVGKRPDFRFVAVCIVRLVDAVRVAELDQMLDLTKAIELLLSNRAQPYCVEDSKAVGVLNDRHGAADTHAWPHLKAASNDVNSLDDRRDGTVG